MPGADDQTRVFSAPRTGKSHQVKTAPHASWRELWSAYCSPTLWNLSANSRNNIRKLGRRAAKDTASIPPVFAAEMALGAIIWRVAGVKSGASHWENRRDGEHCRCGGGTPQGYRWPDFKAWSTLEKC